MPALDLTDRQREVLADVLASALSDVRTEIAGTDRREYRDLLRERREVLEQTIAALRAPAGGAG